MDSCHEEFRQSQGRRGSNQVLARWTTLSGEDSYVYYILTVYILHSGPLKQHYSDSHGSRLLVLFRELMWMWAKAKGNQFTGSKRNQKVKAASTSCENVI